MKKIVLVICILWGFCPESDAQREKPQKHLYEIVNLAYYAKANNSLPTPATNEKRVVFIGNSITRGWVRMRPQFFTANGYIGRGIGGQASAQLLLRFQQDVVALKPYAVVINAGTNDIAENAGTYDPVFTLNNIRSMAQIAQMNGIRVILASVLPSGGFRWNPAVTEVTQKIDALNRAIKAYAEENGFPYVDYNTVLRDENGAMKAGYSEDGVHPLESAYRIMENVVQPVIKQVLNASAGNLSVGSYNIRNSNVKDSLEGNGWQQRDPVIARLIKYNNFDIWGAQEVKYNQLGDLLRSLPDYDYIGVGREDGKKKGEYAPIFYKKDKFEVLHSGHFWLSEDTSKPNKGWDAAYVRICTWGEFVDRKTNFRFWHFNLHTDHKGEVAMRESSKLVLRKIKEMCGNDAVILTGDFNVDQSHESYQLLASSGVVCDSYEKAKFRYVLNGTINHFNPNLNTNSRIDHIFITPDLVVDKYSVLTDTYRYKTSDKKITNSAQESSDIIYENSQARTPSDHFPVRVDLSYTK